MKKRRNRKKYRSETDTQTSDTDTSDTTSVSSEASETKKETLSKLLKCGMQLGETEIEEDEFGVALDPVVLTPEEETEFQELAAYYEHDYFDLEEISSEDDCDFSPHRADDTPVSPQPLASENECHEYGDFDDDDVDDTADKSQQQAHGHGKLPGTTVPHKPRLKVPKVVPILHSHDELLKFLLDTPNKKDELLATCHWNDSPYRHKVYSLFRITQCIVNPNYFFASDFCPTHKVSTILNQLERSKAQKNLSWSNVKRRLRKFLACYEGFEKLADSFHLEDARYMIKKFDAQIQCALDSELPKPHWYKPFKTVTETLVNREECHRQSAFQEYILALLNQINVVTGGYYPSRRKELILTLPAQKSRPEMYLDVNPDFMVLGTRPGLMLVGEVKRFGSRGTKYVNHVGERVKKVQSDVSDLKTPHTELDTDQPRGEGDQLPPTVTKKDTPLPSVTKDEPHASTNKEQTGSSTKSEKSTIPVRRLDAKERYKVGAYMPQLFGQMLSAMQLNEMPSTTYRFCKDNENVQFGFGVEGFKLRFVKLTMISLNKKKRPTVNELLTGQPIKCHISMTQEFNLLNRHHLEMFYKMLLTMTHLCLH